MRIQSHPARSLPVGLFVWYRKRIRDMWCDQLIRSVTIVVAGICYSISVGCAHHRYEPRYPPPVDRLLGSWISYASEDEHTLILNDDGTAAFAYHDAASHAKHDLKGTWRLKTEAARWMLELDNGGMYDIVSTWWNDRRELWLHRDQKYIRFYRIMDPDDM